MPVSLNHPTRTAAISPRQAETGSPDCVVCNAPVAEGELHFCSDHLDWTITAFDPKGGVPIGTTE